MIQYKLNGKEIAEEIEEAFNYYSIEDLNAIYEFIKRNESNMDPVIYSREKNRLETVKKTG